jgi:anaphase-promoting complex subunit 2
MMSYDDWRNDLIRYIDQLIIKLSKRKCYNRINSKYDNNNEKDRSKYSQLFFIDLINYIYDLKNKLRFSNDSMNITNMIIYNKIGYFLKEQIIYMITSNFDINDDINNINEDNMKIFQLIYELQWNKCYRDQYILSFIKIIESKIILICNEKIYNIKYLEQLDSFIKGRLMKYIQLILYNNYFNENIDNNILDNDYYYYDSNNNNITNKNNINSLKELINELIYIALDVYLKYRSKSLFEMIADYPDSLQSIEELKYILHKTNNISYIGKNFRIILQKRLLHIGASTSQILEYYILLIKILRFLDNNQSSDILLYYITKPIRNYLLTRHDTIKCIITSILTSSNSNNNNRSKGDDVNGIESNLYLELKHGGSLEYSPDEDDEDNDGCRENWEPRKRNKDLIENNSNSIINNNDNSSSSNRSNNMDTLALLVSIYDSTDLFIVEYRALLADKLLTSAGFITDHEVTNLELLKIR